MRHGTKTVRWAATVAVLGAVGGGAVVGCKKDEGDAGVAQPAVDITKPDATAAGALKAYVDALAAGDVGRAKSLTAKAELDKLQGADVDGVFRRRSEEQKRSPWTIAPAPNDGSGRSPFVVTFVDNGRARAGEVHVV
ncbi:MAG TPA: hypothetical protein VF796_10080, partial [Humisphaera sp.]